jgi:hypothetical protein
VKIHLDGMYAWIQHLEAVELSTCRFLQYHAMQAKKLWKESEIKTKYKTEIERYCCNDENFDEHMCFDSYEKLPSFNEEFFTASMESNLKIMKSIRN